MADQAGRQPPVVSTEPAASAESLGAFPGKYGVAACAAVAALCYFLSIRFIDLWPVALLAPLPLLVAAFAARSRWAAALCTFAALLIGNFGWWATDSFFLSFPAFLGVHALSAIALTAIVLVARDAARAWNGLEAAFVFPVLLTALSFVFCLSSPDGTWGSSAYSQVNFLPLLQIVSVTGLWGLTFAMALPASGAAVAWYKIERGEPWRWAAAAPLGLFAGVMIFGAARIYLERVSATVRVGLVASDRYSSYSRTSDPGQALELLSFYTREVAKAAREGAQVVVIPERTVGATPADRGRIVRFLGAMARLSGVWLLVGINDIGRKPMLNTALLFSPEGTLAAEYHKHHFVRGFESGYEPGRDFCIVNAPWGTTGVAICKDLDFPSLGRAYGKADVRLMLVPAWDWEGPNAVIHEHMALVRGVEQGFSVARSAKTGFVTAHDAFGRTIASGSTFAEDPVTVVADVPLGGGSTIYTRLGDWFGWLCVIYGLIILARAFAPSLNTRILKSPLR